MILRRRAAIRAIAILMVLIGLEAWLAPLSIYSWLTAMVFTPLIGMINSHFHESSRANARLKLAQEEVERLAKVDERERIARDLHDLLGHSLSVVTLKSELAERLLHEEGPDAPTPRTLERVRRELLDVKEISRKAMAEVRSSISGYRTHSLHSELAKAKVALAAAQIQCRIVSTPYDLDPVREPVAALALREAITNVVRHSRALSCSITLRTGTTDGGRTCFELLVEDDGQGLRGDEGSGLTGMRERVEGIGGSLQLIDLGSGLLRSGCRLEVRLPKLAMHEAEPSPVEDPRVAGLGG